MRTLLIPLLLTFPALSDTYIHNSIISNSIIGSNTLYSTNSGALTTKNINFKRNFNSITINIPANVKINYSNKRDISIKIEKKFIKNILTNIDNNMLTISSKGSINSRFKIDITINVPTLFRLNVRSTAKVKINKFHLKNFILSTSGTSSVTFISGDIQKFLLNSSGTSKIYLETIDVKNATIVSTGTSKIRIKVSDNLNVDLSNITKVMYIGNPIIKKKLRGLGKLIKIK